MTQNWIDQIDDLTINFNDTFGQLSSEQLSWKPDSDSWNIAQVIDHIIVVSRSYEPTFKALGQGTYKPPFIGKIGFLVKLMGKTILEGSGPDRRKKISTFPVWQPSQTEIQDDLMARFDKTQLELQQWIRNSADLIGRGTVISSPANRNIVYKLETALDIILAHQGRHFEQAKEVLQLIEQG